MAGMALLRGSSDPEVRILEKVERLLQAAEAAARDGRERKAAALHARALSFLDSRRARPRDPSSEWADAYARAAAGLLAVGDVPSAQAAAAQALGIDSQSPRGLAVQGDLFLAAGRPAEALPYYDASLRNEPRGKDIWERKGDAHAALGQRPEAIRAYVQVVNLDANDVDGYARILSLAPQDVDLWVRKGDAHRRRGEVEDGHESYDRALRIDSSRRDALEGKAQAYLATGETDRALRCLERVIQIDGSDPDAWRLRGDVLAVSNRTEDALRSYDEALRLRDGDPTAWFARAELLRRLGKNAEAVGSYERGIAP